MPEENYYLKLSNEFEGKMKDGLMLYLLAWILLELIAILVNKNILSQSSDIKRLYENALKAKAEYYKNN